MKKLSIKWSQENKKIKIMFKYLVVNISIYKNIFNLPSHKIKKKIRGG